MKLAAVLTAHVMDKISHLPGVATLDWCDRAAAALGEIHRPSAASVVIGRLDAKGFLTRLESAGAARCLASTPEQSGARYHPPAELAEPEEVSALRNGFREGDWLGWSVGQLAEERWFVTSASQLGLLQRRGESPLGQRWDAFKPTELLLGALVLPGEPGRLVLVELGLLDQASKDIDRLSVVLSAALPMLGQRLINAIGTEPADKHKWLTPREELVLWHLVAGLKVPQIAAELHRSVYTVHDHVKSLHRKLGASNRGQLVARALGHLGPLNIANTPADDDIESELDAAGDTLEPSAIKPRSN